MRYYDLTLTDPTTGKPLRRWSSHPGGQFDPQALNVIFDMPVTVDDEPVHQPTVIIEGISLQDVTNAQQFATTITQDGKLTGGSNLILKAGMQAGLPLANPAQAATLVQGFVFQSWGNWINTDMSLSLVIVPAIYRQNAPGNFVFTWTAGQPLVDALKQTLSVAFPNVQVSFSVSENLIAAQTDVHYCATFGQLAAHVRQLTRRMLGPNYGGVRMAFGANTIRVFDGTQQTPIALLQFTDFVGQPTWIEQNKIQVKTVMRGDIRVGDFIEFPIGFTNSPGFVTTQHAAYPSFNRYQSAIQGKFIVTQIRHVGNFRDPDGNSWVSIFNAVPVLQ